MATNQKFRSEKIQNKNVHKIKQYSHFTSTLCVLYTGHKLIKNNLGSGKRNTLQTHTLNFTRLPPTA